LKPTRMGGAPWKIGSGSSRAVRAASAALAEEALGRGDRVVLAAHNAGDIAGLASANPGRALAVALDVTDTGQTRASVDRALAEFGRIDVLVNNAGIGLLGALEEATDDQIRRNIETNLIGPLNVIRAALPTLRAQQSGRIINMSAIAAFSNEVGFAVYGGAKAALEAASESLRGELAPFGIKVTVVVPGPFRTDFIARSLDRSPPRPEYEGTVGKFAGLLARIDGKQAGDPFRAAEAIIRIADEPDPPFRLVLGRYALDKFRKKLKTLGAELDRWEAAGRDTDYPPSLG